MILNEGRELQTFHTDKSRELSVDAWSPISSVLGDQHEVGGLIRIVALEIFD